MDWVTTFLGATRARILALLRRSTATITDLAETVGVTGNAVRGHVTALQRDGLVTEVGRAPSTGGKPAQLYDLTTEAEELFPKGYAFVLAEVIRTIRARDGLDATEELLAEVGRAAAGSVDVEGLGRGARVEVAADALRLLGADVAVSETEDGWEIRGFGCPLSAVVSREPATCSLARALVGEIVEGETVECCDREGSRPRCAFRVVDSDR